MRYEEWEDDVGVVLVPDDANKAKKLGAALPDGGRLVWSIEADTWEDARWAQHEHRGWEQPYVPWPDAVDGPVPPDV